MTEQRIETTFEDPGFTETDEVAEEARMKRNARRRKLRAAKKAVREAEPKKTRYAVDMMTGKVVEVAAKELPKKAESASPEKWSVEWREKPQQWGVRHGSRILKWAKTKELAEKLMEGMTIVAPVRPKVKIV